MSKKICGLLILFAVYILAFLVGYVSFVAMDEKIDIIYNLLLANVLSTIFIWIVGIFLKTASVYDPYWSLQTVVIYISLLIKYNNVNLGNILYLLCISFWAIRLTYNFICGFNDITYLDWRYKKIKENTKSLYQIVSLIGIHLVPTLIVYIASVPAFLYVINNNSFELSNLIGLIIMIIATIIEMVADINMRQYKKNRQSRNEIINIGLWKYSRHPNYLGEILFWYGVALVFILSNLSLWYFIIGAILNTLLFLFISVPMAENNLKTYKTGYEEYKAKTRMFLPIKK